MGAVLPLFIHSIKTRVKKPMLKNVFGLMQKYLYSSVPLFGLFSFVLRERIFKNTLSFYHSFFKTFDQVERYIAHGVTHGVFQVRHYTHLVFYRKIRSILYFIMGLRSTPLSLNSPSGNTQSSSFSP